MRFNYHGLWLGRLIFLSYLYVPLALGAAAITPGRWKTSNSGLGPDIIYISPVPGSEYLMPQ